MKKLENTKAVGKQIKLRGDFWKAKTIDKLLARLIKKREDFNKITNNRRHYKMPQKLILISHCEQLYIKKLDNLEEMDKS